MSAAGMRPEARGTGRGVGVVDRGSVSRVMLPLRALFDALSDGVLVTDGGGCRTYSNPALNSLVGGDAREPVGSADPPAFLPSHQHDRYRDYLRRFGREFEEDEILSLNWEILDATGGLLPVAIKLIPVRNGGRRPAAVFWLFLVADTLDVPSPSLNTDRRRRELEDGVRRIATELHRLGLGPRTMQPATVDSGVPGVELLSTRERDVVDLLLEGHRVVTIADQLCLSAHTIRNHLKSVFRKLQVHSQTELIELFKSNATRS